MSGGRVGAHQPVVDDVHHLEAGKGGSDVGGGHLLRNIQDTPAISETSPARCGHVEILVFQHGSGTQDVIHRPVTQLTDILATPGDHFGKTFLPANLGLPTHVSLDRARVQPVPRVLAETVPSYLAELREGYAKRLGRQLDHPADRRRLLGTGIVHPPERCLLSNEMDRSREIASMDVGFLHAYTAVER